MKKTIVISAIDLHLIDKVRELRILSDPSVSQEMLSSAIGQAEGFVKEIETFKDNSLYSIRQLNLIANYFNIKISDLFPKDSITEDLLELEIELINITPTAIQIDKYGEVIKHYRIINGRVITIKSSEPIKTYLNEDYIN